MKKRTNDFIRGYPEGRRSDGERLVKRSHYIGFAYGITQKENDQSNSRNGNNISDLTVCVTDYGN